ncbi:MAG: Lysine--tRNA ligase [Chlamydiae bacterium]|nr:Lysine--tRNA ligase [Chlamydiota bacterium]
MLESAEKESENVQENTPHQMFEYESTEDFQIRLAKLEYIKSVGVEPYPHKFFASTTFQEVIEKYEGQDIGDSEKAAAGDSPEVSVSGRLVLFRAMGKNAFAQIQAENFRMQIMINRDLSRVTGYNPTGEESQEHPKSGLKFIEKKVDLGDIIGIKGHLFHTQKGELTLYAKEATLLCKSLLPLPDKHSGLVDKEVRYRKRWLDLISCPDVYNTFYLRSKIVRLVRNCCEEENFMEVETPIVQNNYGGANADPFITQVNALNKQEMFLRISLEINLKKLLVGGIPRLFEIGKVFRNEGIDRTHNPEFTMLEAYASYWDYNDMMRFQEKIFSTIAKELYGTEKVPFVSQDGQEIVLNFTAPWPRLTMKGSIKKYAEIDVDTLNDKELKKLVLEKCDIDPKTVVHSTRGMLIANLFEDLVEEHLIQPVHIIDHPIETTPLCKTHRSPDGTAGEIVERFESFIMGSEVSNAYSELNDPIKQKELLENQVDRKALGDEETHPLDEEFIESICQGMPPSGGIGIGIDRLVMLFTNQHTIREVIYFPLMKPKGS